MTIKGTFAQLLALQLGRGMLVAYRIQGGAGHVTKFTLYYHSPRILYEITDNVTEAAFLAQFPNAVQVGDIQV